MSRFYILKKKKWEKKSLYTSLDIAYYSVMYVQNLTAIGHCVTEKKAARMSTNKLIKINILRKRRLNHAKREILQ